MFFGTLCKSDPGSCRLQNVDWSWTFLAENVEHDWWIYTGSSLMPFWGVLICQQIWLTGEDCDAMIGWLTDQPQTAACFVVRVVMTSHNPLLLQLKLDLVCPWVVSARASTILVDSFSSCCWDWKFSLKTFELLVLFLSVICHVISNISNAVLTPQTSWTLSHFNFWLSLSKTVSWTLKSGLRPKFKLTLDLDFGCAGSDSTPALPFREFACHGWN